MASSLEYIAVPFEEKENAKKLGAKWDWHERKWYIPAGLETKDKLLEKYKINEYLDEILGEDRTFGGNELFVDLIPSSCWFKNARNCIHPCDWDRVRNCVYARVNYTCECCGVNAKENKIQLDAHERWYYDNHTKTQKLVRLVAICQQCHQATHMGFAEIQGKRKEAMAHLQKVRGFTESECLLHIENAFEIWKTRNKYKWNLDLSLLEFNGIRLSDTKH